MSLPWDYIAKLVCIGDSGTGKSSLTIRLCEGRFSPTHDVTIGVEFGSRIVPVGPPASDSLNIASEPEPSSSSAPLTAGAGSTQNKNNNNNNDAVKQEKEVMGLPTPPRKSQKPQPIIQKKMKLSLWDTAGQETYKSITRSYFRGASGALLVFDITRPSTFASVTQWLQDLRQIADDGIVVVLVGNKSDLVAGDDDTSPRVTRQEAEEWCRLNNVMRYIETSAKSGDGVEQAFLEVAERIYRNIESGKYDLNDRRSGVKGYGATNGSVNATTPRTITLGLNDAMNRGRNGWNDTGCC